MIMDVKKNQKGQAVLEFMVFLPFILMMYSLTMSLGNSINASINQQKVTRGYFYYRMAGDSTAPQPRRGNEGFLNNMRVIGMSVRGWMKRLVSNNPEAPCYKFNLLLGEDSDDICEEAYSEPSTQFIRVGTVYGICGATYARNQTGFLVPYPRASANVAGTNLCSNAE